MLGDDRALQDRSLHPARPRVRAGPKIITLRERRSCCYGRCYTTYTKLDRTHIRALLAVRLPTISLRSAFVRMRPPRERKDESARSLARRLSRERSLTRVLHARAWLRGRLLRCGCRYKRAVPTQQLRHVCAVSRGRRMCFHATMSGRAGLGWGGRRGTPVRWSPGQRAAHCADAPSGS
jgi:hypothetical protein